NLLKEHKIAAGLEFIKSEGDIDLQTPLYEMGVQGIFTKTLDTALVNKKIDIAVHSMKDVPTQLAFGIVQAAVLKRGSYKDILVKHEKPGVNIDELLASFTSHLTIATSSIRRKAQWLHRYPDHKIENLRGNVNTRLNKITESYWDGAIFAAAGLERICLRPKKSIELDWMLPAPSQGAIVVVCREEDEETKQKCALLNDEETATCTKIEKDFLRALLGGCSTPISALAEIEKDELFFRGNILSLDGRQKKEIEKILPVSMAANLGAEAAKELLENGGQEIANSIRNATK
ncbi:MAG: hydroxymethylbilane synthase, partial [Bacteroidetes bacterium]|nr:hydroxymethylbilane synthase [Bacteroidota bacterium]